MANETLGASFGIDVTNLKAGLAQANRLIKESQSEFQAAAAGMDDWTQSEDGLNKKIRSLNTITDLQGKKVAALKSEYKRLIDNGLDPTSKEAVELRTKINNESAAMEKSAKEAAELAEELRKLRAEEQGVGDAAEEAAEETGGFGEAAKGAVASIAAVGAACVGLVSSFLGLAESTRESRNEMAKLQTSFQTAGLSAENAEQTFTELYGIMGDEGAATEAAQQLAKFSTNEQDLAANTRILTGVMAEYGGSIPLEGLAEGMAATAAMGEVQGSLADALEWQGVNLEDYNAKLATLATEEERAAYIQSTLTDLYGDSADAYAENNAEVIASNKAQAKLNDTLNELGEIAEPIMTTIKTLAAELLESITPFVSLIGEGLSGALNGTAGAANNLATGLSGVLTTIINKIVETIPFIIQTVIAVVPQLLTALLAQLPTILQTVIDIVIQVINALSAMLPTIVTAIMEVLPQLINALIAAIPQLLEAAIQLLMAIVDAIPTIINALIENLPKIITTIINGVLDALPLLLDASIKLLFALIDAIPTIVAELVKAMPQITTTIISSIISAVPKLLKTAGELFLQIIKAIPQLIKQLPSKMGEIITGIVSGLKKGISKIKDVGKNIIEGLWNGIKDMTSWIGKKIKGFGESVLSGLKSFFGIKSPSRVMADQVGKNLALGIGMGFEKNIAGVNEDITDAMNFDDPNYPTGGAPRRAVSRFAAVTFGIQNAFSNLRNSISLKRKAKTKRGNPIWRCPLCSYFCLVRRPFVRITTFILSTTSLDSLA